MKILTKELAAATLVGMVLSGPSLAAETDTNKQQYISWAVHMATVMEVTKATEACAMMIGITLAPDYLSSINDGFTDKKPGYTIAHKIEKGTPYICVTKNL